MCFLKIVPESEIVNNFINRILPIEIVLFKCYSIVAWER